MHLCSVLVLTCTFLAITTALPVAQEVKNVVPNPIAPVANPVSIADPNVPNLVPLVVDPNPTTTTVAPVVVTTVPTTTLKPNATQVEGGDDDDSSEEEDEETNDVNDDDDNGDDDEPGSVSNDEEEDDNDRKREIYVPGYLSDLGELVVPIEAVMGQGATYEIVENVEEVLKEEQAAQSAVTALEDNLAVETGEGVIGVVSPQPDSAALASPSSSSGEVKDTNPVTVNEVEAKENTEVVAKGQSEIPASSQSVENVKAE